MKTYSKPLLNLLIPFYIPVQTQTGGGTDGGGNDGGGNDGGGGQGNIQIGCEGDLFDTEGVLGGAAQSVTVDIITSPALENLNECEATLINNQGNSRTLKFPEDITLMGCPSLVNHGNGEFSLTCYRVQGPSGEPTDCSIDCSSKGYGTSSVNDCPDN